MRIRVQFVVLLTSLVSSGNAADVTLPWSFVNGSAKGYSIQLVTASPARGTKVTVGQTVDFKVTVSYQLSIAHKGAIIVVIQDEKNKNLMEGKAQQSQSVNRGKGTVTLAQNFTVPAGVNEVRLFIPLVPKGLEHTDGELVLRYPVSYEVKSSSIGYPSVAVALADLHSKPEVHFSEAQGRMIAD